MAQFVTVPENNFSGGINQNAIETMIPDGFIEMGYNAETNSSGSLSKRRGYQNFGGWVPVRATSIEADGSKLTLSLPAGVNLSSYNSAPLYLTGFVNTAPQEPYRLSRYFDKFRANIRKPLVAPSGTLALETLHGFSQPYMDVGITESLSTSTNDHETFTPGDIHIATANNHVSIDYDVGSNKNAFVYFKEHFPDPLVGQVALYTPATLPVGVSTLSFAHGLNSTALGYALFVNEAGVLTKVMPDALVLEDANNLTLTVRVPVESDIELLVWKITETQYVETPVAGGASGYSEILAPQTPFIFTYSYITDGTGKRYATFPDTVSYSAADNKATITFTDTEGFSAGNNLTTFWECVEITNVNVIEVDSDIGFTLTDNVSLSIYGLDHSLLYATPMPERAGWVNHIDSYLTANDQHVVCGLGGALFKSYDSEVTPLHINLQGRFGDSRTIGPAFWSSVDRPAVPRTRDYVAFTGGALHTANIETITHLGAGSMAAVVRVPAYTVLDKDGGAGSLANAFSAGDHITIERTGYSVNSGEFAVVQVTSIVDDPDRLQVTYYNPNISNSYWDEVDCGGTLGCFTDTIMVPDTKFQADDLILASNILEAQGISVIYVDSLNSEYRLRNVVDSIAVVETQKLLARRTSSIVPLRAADGTASVAGYVAGDMTALGEIINVNAASDQDFTMSDGTYTCSDTSYWTTGTRLQLQNADTQEVITISNILTAATFEADGSLAAGSIVGKTIALDNPTTFEDDTSNQSPLTIPYRWRYIESTANSVVAFESNTPTTQNTIRSTMASESMFLTSATDAIVKYDGANQYRAGLPRWNPLIGFSLDTGASDKIYLADIEASVVGYSGRVFTLGTAAAFNLGDKVTYTNSTLGSEVITAAADRVPASGTNWSGTNWGVSGGTFAHTVLGANTATLATYAAVASTQYQVSVLIATTASGTLTVNWGGASKTFNLSAGGTATQTFRLTASSTAGLTVVPSAAWLGSITAITIKAITSTDAPVFTITSLDAVENTITVDSTITGAVDGTLALAGLYRYYFRLEGVDRNGSIVASAATALGDVNVLLTADAAVTFKFAPLPTGIGNFPVNNISLQIYRTRQGTSAPFYHVTTIPMTSGEDMTYSDGKDDALLVDLDTVNSALLGQEVGTTWDAPPRAECLTVLNNRLLLGNVTDLPELTLALVERTQEVNFTNLNALTLTVNGVAFKATTSSTPVSAVTADGGYAKLTTAAAIPEGQWCYFTNGIAASSGWCRVTTNDGAGHLTTDMPYVNATAGEVAFLSGYVPIPLFNTNCVFRDITTGTEVMRRFAAAINAYSARASSYLTADAGDVYGVNTLNIKLPRSDTTLNVTADYSSDSTLYVDGIYTAKQSAVTSTGKPHRSRVMLSKPKFPEIFDAVDEVLDINPEDGETITGIVPFFGRSAFGAAQTDGPLLVFKTNSVYVVDTNTKQVKKLDTQNLGCTFPYSIANTKNGVMFANYSGIYSIDQNLRLEYLGENVRRSWRELVDRTRTYTLTAHHHGNSNRYKLSAPLLTSNGQNYWSFVYDHTCENSTQVAMTGQMQRGAWMVYAPLAATGWCNFGKDELMARSDGRVWIARRTGGATDYRDGADPIEYNVTLKANMFGNGSIRKTVRRVIAHFRSVGESVIQVSQSINASNTFGVLDGIRTWTPIDAVTVLDPVTVVPPGYQTGLSDNAGLRVMDVVISPKNARCLFYRLNFYNNELDQGVELAGVEYRVSGLSHTGIVSAAGSAAGGTNAGT